MSNYSYRDYLDKRGVARGPWVTRDRDGSGEAGETRSKARPEGQQPGSRREIAQNMCGES